MKHYLIFPILSALMAVWIVAVRRFVPEGRLRMLVQAVPFPCMAAYMFVASQPATFLSDYKKAYHPAAELVVKGDGARLYDGGPLLFVNIPIVAWIFAPLTAASDHTAGQILTALGIVAVIAATALLVRFAGLREPRAVMFAGIVVANGPLYNSLREGNTTHFIWLMLIVALWCLELVGRARVTGALLAVAVVIKPPLGLLLVPQVLRARWGVVAAFVVVSGALVALSLALYGFDLHRTWYETCVEPFAREPLGASSVQSLDAVLARMTVGDKYIFDFTPIAEFGNGFRIVRTLILAALLLVALGICVRWRGGDAGVLLRQEFCIALCLSLMAPPTSWAHYYLLLLIPIALVLGGRLGMPASRPWWIALGIVVALISPPVVALDTENEAVRAFMGRVGCSHYFFGGLLLLAMILVARVRGGAGDAISRRQAGASM